MGTNNQQTHWIFRTCRRTGKIW